MSNTNYLPVFTDLFHFYTNFLSCFSAYSGINFIKYHCGNRISVCNNAFKCKHNSRQFTARCYFGNRLRFFPFIGRYKKLYTIHTIYSKFTYIMLYLNNNIRHIKKTKFFGYSSDKQFRYIFSMFRYFFSFISNLMQQIFFLFCYFFQIFIRKFHFR